MMTADQRQTALALLRAGHRPAEVAQMLAVNNSAVYHLRDKLGLEKPHAPKPQKPRIIEAASIIEASHQFGGQGEWDWLPHGEPQPTAAVPGTREKVEVLAERALRGVELWCDSDGVRNDDGREEAA